MTDPCMALLPAAETVEAEYARARRLRLECGHARKRFETVCGRIWLEFERPRHVPKSPAAPSQVVARIISSGEPGADRAALDFAISAGLAHGGWCLRGRMALDGRLDDRYQMQELPNRSRQNVMERNIQEAGATLIFSLKSEAGLRARETMKTARDHGKPCLHVHDGTSIETVQGFLQVHRPVVINVAGSREEGEPGIYLRVRNLLGRLLTPAELRHEGTAYCS